MNSRRYHLNRKSSLFICLPPSCAPPEAIVVVGSSAECEVIDSCSVPFCPFIPRTS
jgi:hypothetical protein